MPSIQRARRRGASRESRTSGTTAAKRSYFSRTLRENTGNAVRGTGCRLDCDLFPFLRFLMNLVSPRGPISGKAALRVSDLRILGRKTLRHRGIPDRLGEVVIQEKSPFSTFDLPNEGMELF